MNQRWLLLRYDVESNDPLAMAGFLPRLTAVHREHALPVTLFCTGTALEANEEAFRAFHADTAGDRTFEIGDHSYNHIGIGYESGKPVSALRADYERSLAAHERILGSRPDTVSICGTSVDGPRLSGFDMTEKAREELAILASLGIRQINTFLSAHRESEEFVDYSALEFPEITGFPSDFSDTGWLWKVNQSADFLAPLRAEIDRRSAENLPLPIISHDWVAWNHAPDQALTHIVRLAEYARSKGFEPLTIGDAVRSWRNSPLP